MPMLTTLRMRLPVWPFQSPLRTRLEKSAMLVENGVHVGDDVLAIDHDGRTARRAQRHVQHGPVLRDVDLVAAKHRVDALAQARLLGQLQQQLQRFVGDAVLGIVEIEARRLDRQLLAAVRIVGEQLLQLQVLRCLIMFLKQLPGRAPAQRWPTGGFGASRLDASRLDASRLGAGRFGTGRVGRGCHGDQLALRMTALLDLTQSIRSSQDLTNDTAPSS